MLNIISAQFQDILKIKWSEKNWLYNDICLFVCLSAGVCECTSFCTFLLRFLALYSPSEFPLNYTNSNQNQARKKCKNNQCWFVRACGRVCKCVCSIIIIFASGLELEMLISRKLWRGKKKQNQNKIDRKITHLHV